MSLKFFQAGKFILAAGLVVVLVQGLLRLPELQDYLFPGKHFQTELQDAEDRCLQIEDDLTSLRGRVEALEGLLASKTQNRKVSVAGMLLSPWSEGMRSLFPEFYWKVNLYLGKKTRVRLEKSLKYLDASLQNLDLQNQSALSQNGAEPVAKNYAGANPLQYTQEIRGRSQIWRYELKELFDKLNSLEVRGKNL